MALVFFGVCHTFTYPDQPDKDRTYSTFYLNPGLNYRIFIHDPKFYLPVVKSGIFPRMFVHYKSEKDTEPGYYEAHEISVTEHHLLNRPEQPCEEEEEDYDFLQCVKTSQARMVGCRPPWDSWSPHTIPLCQTMDQLDQHEKLDMTFFYTRQKKIVKDFGCRIPCTYKVCEVLEYQLIC